MARVTALLCLWVLISSSPAFCQLTPNFYFKTCPALEAIVFNTMQLAVLKEPRVAASILRLFFHDCFVQGCDASILLDDTANVQSEKSARPNNQSVRGFEVIDSIKAQVEARCRGVVSCADILALAARDGVVLSGGPIWRVLLGRRDSLTASFTGANNIPSPFSTVSQLTAKFLEQGLSIQDMVALSGGHTIGQARCLTFRPRLYNQSGTGQPDATLDTAYLAQLQGRCPSAGGDANLSPLDPVTPIHFDNQYFVNLENGKGLLNSDEALFSTGGSSTIGIVRKYAGNPNAFFNDFTTAMVNMGNINPLTGLSGEIRSNCRFRN